MKRKKTAVNLVGKDWYRWEMFGEYGIMNELSDVNFKDDYENPVKVKITIEEI